MAKRKRTRIAGTAEDFQEAEERISGLPKIPGERVDPTIAAVKAATPGERFSTREGLEELAVQARAQGCTCQHPNFVLRELEPGAAHVLMMHEDECPLMRVLNEQKPR